MHFREKIEEVIVKRLSDKGRDVREVPDDEFETLRERLNELMTKMSKSRVVIGFTEEDIYSFLTLKLHQLLRRDQYNKNLSQNKFFFYAFRNLITDIERMKDGYLRNHGETRNPFHKFYENEAELIQDKIANNKWESSFDVDALDIPQTFNGNRPTFKEGGGWHG